METLRVILLHFGIATAMAAAFGAASVAGKMAAKINFRIAREGRRRRTRETIYWRALTALRPAADE
jgi:hypothetical protein